jgi:hypothetical protein
MANRYAVYVADDNGWADSCPSYHEVFFGAREPYACPSDGGIGIAGHVIVSGYRAAHALARELATTGDWVAPDEINPEGLTTRPTYAVVQVHQDRTGAKQMNTVVMKCPAGYGIAGSGWSRHYATLDNAQRAFNRLMGSGYEAGVVSHPNNPNGLRFAVLVSRYQRGTYPATVKTSEVQSNG